RITGALRAMKDLATAMVEALRAGDVARVATLLSHNWMHQQALDPGMRTPEMAQLENALTAAGALGGKAAGAGAGGSMFFVTGERHDRHWARYQHLGLAERAAHLATLAALGGDARAADRAHEILRAYAQRYFRYPNRDNVLGPSRLFFSTYLESIWIGNYVAAAALLRAGETLDDATTRDVSRVADEAANLIGEFDEGFSNRQTWNNAALAAIAVWFEDEDLAKRAIEGPTGLLEHLLRGYGRDGMWYEGENYHLFALRGWLTGALWARQAAVDVVT